MPLLGACLDTLTPCWGVFSLCPQPSVLLCLWLGPPSIYCPASCVRWWRSPYSANRSHLISSALTRFSCAAAGGCGWLQPQELCRHGPLPGLLPGKPGVGWCSFVCWAVGGGRTFLAAHAAMAAPWAGSRQGVHGHEPQGSPARAWRCGGPLSSGVAMQQRGPLPVMCACRQLPPSS